MTETKYFGKYRGTVVQNLDPLNIGRIQVSVPDVTAIPSTWAMPCVPYAGMQMGMYAIPSIGAGVWVEYEQGNPDHPIWTGCWWGSAAEVPALALATPTVIPHIHLQTALQNSISISDLPGPTGGILLKNSTGAFIMINETGITISNGQGAIITMTGPMIDFNLGALNIT